ncbi:hypothetical protein OHV13_30865 [Kitasatospora purpeofusca]|uniref:hypothetical protein n=1 Tax=Kitasatospora purpeofusca TaxID=67352 RepID=UPI00324BC2A8
MPIIPPCRHLTGPSAFPPAAPAVPAVPVRAARALSAPPYQDQELARLFPDDFLVAFDLA